MTVSGAAGARRAVREAGRRGRWHRCSCGRPIPEEVRRCSSRTCPEFAPTWARDTRRRLFVNLEQLKLSVMFSVTAPGADLYPFDPRFCSHSPSQRCSGRLGCRVAPELAADFKPERRQVVERAPPCSEGPGGSRDRVQGEAGVPRVGETEAWAGAFARRHLCGVVDASAVGRGVRDGTPRDGAALRVRLRRRLAQRRA